MVPDSHTYKDYEEILNTKEVYAMFTSRYIIKPITGY